MAEHLRQTGVSLCDLFDDAQVVTSAPAPITGCSCDWRQVQPGDAFVAVTEDTDDGHDHAFDAAQRGAAVVVCERQLPVFGVPQLVVTDSRQAYGRLCHALAGRPAEHLRVVGVTGTSGKTCVTVLFESILAEAGVRSGTINSLGYNDSGDYAAATVTQDPATFAHWLGRMVMGGASHGIVELSSTALAKSNAAGMTLDAVCVTNLDRDHLDRHGSVENYRRAKRRIFEQLAPQGVAVLGADDPHCCRILADLEQPALTFGIHRPAEVAAHLVEQYVGEQTFLIEAGSDAVAVRSRIVGEHHRYNCLAAATLGLAYGIDLATIARGLQSVERIPGRMDRVEFGQPFGLWLDVADSPHQLRASLTAVREVAKGRVTCVLVPRPQESRETRRRLHQVVKRLSERSIIVESQSADARRSVVDFSAATRWALRQAEAGEAIVVAVSPEAVVSHLFKEKESVLVEWMREGLVSC